MVCAFTGHRPQRLSWGWREDDARCLALKAQLKQQIEALCDAGCRSFLCGMARGCDIYFAEQVLCLKQKYRDIRLIAMIPCPSQSDSWHEDERLRYQTLLSRCDEVRVLEDHYTDGCMLRRNRAMVDAADVLITVYDGSGGGTGATVRYAAERGVTLLPLWL